MRSRPTALAVAVLLLVVPLAAAQQCDESVEFVTSPGRIDIYHSQSEYNCCSWIGFDVIQDAFTIEVYEWEHLIGGGCDCLCCFDSFIAVGGLDPGEYTVLIYKDSDYSGSELVGEWTVVVEGGSEPLVYASYEACVQASIGETRKSWGGIKGLYQIRR